MKRAAQIVAFNILATLVLFLVLEGASQLIRPVALPDPLVTKNERRSGWDEARQYDPYLFWTLRPHATIGPIGPDSIMATINSLGLRGPEFAPKDPQEFRILSLGESTTWGLKVRYEEAYSSLLEDELPSIKGRFVHVINAGVPAYTLLQGLTYLRLHGLALEPDAVLIYFGYNDFRPVARRVRRDEGPNLLTEGLSDRAVLEARTTLRFRLTYALAKHSNLARLVILSSGAARDTVVANARNPRVPESDRRWILSELRRMASQHGFQLVIIIPWYRSFDKHEPLLREVKAWDEAIVVDLPAQLADLPAPRGSYFSDHVHPNQAGHRLIAEVIGEQLRRAWRSAEADAGE